MRSLLVHADETSGFEHRLQTALDIARAHAGHVTLQISIPVTRFVTMDPFGGAYPMVEALADVRARAATFAAQLNDRLAKEDVPFDVTESEAEAVDGLLIAARYADLTIVGLDAPGRREASGNAALVGALALAAVSPVLALPEATTTMLDGPVLIAWKECSEASRAVRAAMPLLRRASSVHVLTVPEHDDTATGADHILRYLSRHEIQAEQASRTRGSLSIEETIEAAAKAHGASLVVMGAYGHSRVRELLFGGVTRYMIDCGQFPLFLTH
jgi:nucleotide-binding universal stress UspA family protein